MSNPIAVMMAMCLVGTLASEQHQQEFYPQVQQVPRSPWESINVNLTPPHADPKTNTTSEDAVEVEVEEEVRVEEGVPEYDRVSSEFDFVDPIDEILPKLPFNIPLDKKQMYIAMKLAKQALKPLLLSKRLREYVAAFDDFVWDIKSDPTSRAYIAFALDTMQELYEGKEKTQLSKIVSRALVDVEGEETARTITGFLATYIEPLFSRYLYTPVKRYFVDPMYNAVSLPVNNIAKRVSYLLSPEDYSTSHNKLRWSRRFNNYVDSVSRLSSQARDGLDVVARMMHHREAEEEENQGLVEEKRCTKCENLQDYSDIEVTDLTWAVWLGLSVVALLLLAAAIIPPAVAIPVALGGAFGPTGTATGTFPGTLGLTAATGTGFTGFTGPLTGFTNRRDGQYYPYDNVDRVLHSFDDSLLDESKHDAKFDDNAAYSHYTQYAEGSEGSPDMKSSL